MLVPILMNICRTFTKVWAEPLYFKIMLKHLIFSTRREEKQQCFEKKLLFREKYFGYQYLLSLRLDSLLRAKPCAASCGTLAGGSARCPPEGSEEDEEKPAIREDVPRPSRLHFQHYKYISSSEKALFVQLTFSCLKQFIIGHILNRSVFWNNLFWRRRREKVSNS